jgi:hypothetical protein
MIATFSQRGGARLGMLNASWPFARLSATPNALRLSCLGRDYIFPKSNIRTLSKHRGLFSIGLRIEHNDPSLPGIIVFWTSVLWWSSSFRKLKIQLESLGYEIRN